MSFLCNWPETVWNLMQNKSSSGWTHVIYQFVDIFSFWFAMCILCDKGRTNSIVAYFGSNLDSIISRSYRKHRHIYVDQWVLNPFKLCKHPNNGVRVSFKKFCYERLPVRKKMICFTDFLDTYPSFYHTSTREISTLLLAFTVTSVVYSGHYLRMKRKTALR